MKKRDESFGRMRRAWLAQCSAQCIALGLAAFSAGSAQAEGLRSKILVLGDSLSAEYGLTRGSGWVALLEQRLNREQPGATVVNASISGETTSGGRSRLPALLKEQQPTHLVVELGGNDALRGLPVSMTEENLTEIVKAGSAAKARVVLVGMQVPPNYGRKYAQDFAAIYPRVAKATGAALVPFLLAGVADTADAEAWFQADRIHPLAKAHPVMLDNIWPVLKPLLR